MSDLISTASNALQLVTRLRDINKKIANAEFSNTLADLVLELSELKIKVAALLDENDRLKRQASTNAAASLEFKDFAYYTGTGEGPFCPGCYDTQKKTIRLSKLSGAFLAFGSHKCPACNQTFGNA